MENKSAYLLTDKRLVHHMKKPLDPVHAVGAVRCFSAALFAAALLWGCSAFRHPPAPRLDPAPAPNYTLGTTFVYSDGTRETVSEISPSLVTWTDGKGHRSRRPPDSIYLPEVWQTGDRCGTRRFSSQSRDTLWPIDTGKSIRYVESGNWVDAAGVERSYQTLWTCDVIGTERVSVLAGKFDTWKIACGRYAMEATSGRSRKREEKTWYYAPEVGHYALTTHRYYDTRTPRRRELVAVVPPLNDLSGDLRHQLESSFQNAMEYAQSGASVYWNAAESDMGGEIRPVDTFRLPGGAFCRQYVQRLSLPAGQRSYYGIACRDPRGRWITPYDSFQ